MRARLRVRARIAICVLAGLAPALLTTACEPAAPVDVPTPDAPSPAAPHADTSAPPHDSTAGGVPDDSSPHSVDPNDLSPDDGEARAALDRIVHAESTLAYHGWRAVSQGRPGESRATRLRIARPAAGPVRLSWEGGGPGTDGGARRWTTDRRFPWTGRPALLARNYRVVLDPAPGDPVAWRTTRRVRLEPRRAGRPSLELLVDDATWLVLAESYRDADGQEWRNARFESIEYGEPEDETSAAEPLEPAVAVASGPPEFAARAVGALPAGFERVEAALSPCGSWREDFSDGLAGFSVLRAPADADTPPAGQVRRRRWLGGAAVAARVGGVSVTVTGTLPADELLVVLEGLGATNVTLR